MVLDFLLIVVVSFLRFAMQKYSISRNEKQLVKPFRGLVYHVAKIQKNKRLDFNLLQNRNPIVVYGVVYVLWYCFARNTQYSTQLNLSKIKTKNLPKFDF